MHVKWKNILIDALKRNLQEETFTKKIASFKVSISTIQPNGRPAVRLLPFAGFVQFDNYINPKLANQENDTPPHINIPYLTLSDFPPEIEDKLSSAILLRVDIRSSCLINILKGSRFSEISWFLPYSKEQFRLSGTVHPIVSPKCSESVKRLIGQPYCSSEGSSVDWEELRRKVWDAMSLKEKCWYLVSQPGNNNFYDGKQNTTTSNIQKSGVSGYSMDTNRNHPITVADPNIINNSNMPRINLYEKIKSDKDNSKFSINTFMESLSLSSNPDKKLQLNFMLDIDRYGYLVGKEYGGNRYDIRNTRSNVQNVKNNEKENQDISNSSTNSSFSTSTNTSLSSNGNDFNDGIHITVNQKYSEPKTVNEIGVDDDDNDFVPKPQQTNVNKEEKIENKADLKKKREMMLHDSSTMSSIYSIYQLMETDLYKSNPDIIQSKENIINRVNLRKKEEIDPYFKAMYYIINKVEKEKLNIKINEEEELLNVLKYENNYCNFSDFLKKHDPKYRKNEFNSARNNWKILREKTLNEMKRINQLNNDKNSNYSDNLSSRDVEIFHTKKTDKKSDTDSKKNILKVNVKNNEANTNVKTHLPSFSRHVICSCFDTVGNPITTVTDNPFTPKPQIYLKQVRKTTKKNQPMSPDDESDNMDETKVKYDDYDHIKAIDDIIDKKNESKNEKLTEEEDKDKKVYEEEEEDIESEAEEKEAGKFSSGSSSVSTIDTSDEKSIYDIEIVVDEEQLEKAYNNFCVLIFDVDSALYLDMVSFPQKKFKFFRLDCPYFLHEAHDNYNESLPNWERRMINKRKQEERKNELKKSELRKAKSMSEKLNHDSIARQKAMELSPTLFNMDNFSSIYPLTGRLEGLNLSLLSDSSDSQKVVGENNKKESINDKGFLNIYKKTVWGKKAVNLDE